MQPKFKYGDLVSFTKIKEETQRFKETGDLRYIYQNKLDKVFFQLDIANGSSKDVPRRLAFNKVLLEKAFDIAKHLMNTKAVHTNKSGATLTGTEINPFEIMKISN